MVGNLFLPKRSSGQQASLLLRLHAGSRRKLIGLVGLSWELISRSRYTLKYL
ncbi:Uncharacterised protein [Enterobacter hormaechei]|nr:Uncharacterised protein [Enterobacter hormaechei]